jgi:metal-responsive CopG/Arc/MetJ family transcriptional regulator
MYNYGEVNAMPTSKPRFCITVDDDLMKQIDDFRFDNRYGSRSQAVLQLIRAGLDTYAREESKPE